MHVFLKLCSQKNISNVAFTGDSLMREHFQNLVMLLQPEIVKEVNMVKFREEKSVSLKFFDVAEPPQTLNLYYYLFSASVKDLQRIQPDAHFWSFSLLKNLVSERTEELLPELVEKFFMKPYDNLLKSGQSQTQVSRNRFYLHPQIQREDPRINRDTLIQAPLNHSVNSFACLTPGRYEIAISKTLELLKKHGLYYDDGLINGLLPTSARWESSWDGIHYSLLVNEVAFNSDPLLDGQLKPPLVCQHGQYIRGGRHLCGKIHTVSGVNKCVRSRHPRIHRAGRQQDSEADDEYMYWCNNLGNKFHHFEGGVSRMLTMMWINSLCNDR
jgi:hypothetical protein